MIASNPVWSDIGEEQLRDRPLSQSSDLGALRDTDLVALGRGGLSQYRRRSVNVAQDVPTQQTDDVDAVDAFAVIERVFLDGVELDSIRG
ncbi:MAG: hypothetical protein M1516_00020 [Firmicutes bacterium]|jgi:hypothetical protein|nr:hypothetical protein [Bacillota bacterium]